MYRCLKENDVAELVEQCSIVDGEKSSLAYKKMGRKSDVGVFRLLSAGPYFHNGVGDMWFMGGGSDRGAAEAVSTPQLHHQAPVPWLWNFSPTLGRACAPYFHNRVGDMWFMGGGSDQGVAEAVSTPQLYHQAPLPWLQY
jgi:hypothetical protein